MIRKMLALLALASLMAGCGFMHKGSGGHKCMMMGGMSHGSSAPSTEAPAAETPADGKAISYTCPMHPEIVRSEPGTCPKCGMNLVPKQ